MYCYKCGNEIPDDSQFCSKCGNAQNVASSLVTPTNTLENKDLDREAIKIYLSNVLALECVIRKLQDDWDETDAIVQNFEATNYNEQFLCYQDNYVWFRFDGTEYYVWMNRDKHGKYYMNMCEDDIKYAGAWCPMNLNMEYLSKDSSWPNKYCPMNLFVEILYEIFIQPAYRRNTRKSFFELLEEFKKIAPSKHEENEIKIQPVVNRRSGILGEINKAKELLENAYNINLIPQKFRNIYAIWFIQDYISTSNESLSSAFLHCDLDTIKQKLDTIIEQQKEIIINQHILIAQNSRMIDQNQQTLNRLSSIEQNTEIAAQYAKIAANNAEACAWIGVANYIKTK